MKLSELKGMYAYSKNKFNLIYVVDALENGACKVISLDDGFEILISSKSANEDAWHTSLVNYMNIKPEHAKFANSIDIVLANYIGDSELHMGNAITIADTKNPIAKIDFWINKLLEFKDEICIDFEIEGNDKLPLPDGFLSHYIVKVIKNINKFGALVMLYLPLVVPELKCSDIDVDIHVVNDFAAACYTNAMFASIYIFPGVMPIVYEQHIKTAHIHSFNTAAKNICSKYDHWFFQFSKYGIFRANYSGDDKGDIYCEDRLVLPDDTSVPWFIADKSLVDYIVENDDDNGDGDLKFTITEEIRNEEE